MTLRKTYLTTFILFSIIFAFIACSNTSDEKKKVAEIIDFSELPSMVGDSVHTLVSDSGRLTYRLDAPKLAIYDKVKDPYWDFPSGLHMTTFSVEGDIDGDIKSKFAIYNVNKELWELRIDVVAINPDGNKVETELLYWDQKKKLIYTDKFVKITEDGLITTGYGFETDEGLNDWTLKKFSSEFLLDE